MGGRRVEVIIKLLDVLAVVALRAGQAEQPFLQNRIFAVPKREAKQNRWWLSHQPNSASSLHRKARKWACSKGK